MSGFELGKEIVEKLRAAGHITYFAGGWVRDYLRGEVGDDVDIATSANPEQVSQLFPDTIEVGACFGVMIVRHKGQQFEVAMFRQDGEYINGRQPESVCASDPQTDALRRDFTINGMFFDPLNKKILDYVGGREDLEKKVLRAIGDPEKRFQEDRLRMIRAVRFASRFAFEIDEGTAQGIKRYAHELFPAVAVERVWQELQKIKAYSSFDQAILHFKNLNLLSLIFPELANLQHSDLENRVANIKKLSEESPCILYCLALMPDLECSDYERFCKRYKLSKKDFYFVDLFVAGRGLCARAEVSAYEWVLFYAQDHVDFCIECLAAVQKEQYHNDFINLHKKKQNELAMHIDRKKAKRPLVTAADLMKKGLKPSPQLGKFLEEAAEISVNKNLHEKEAVIEQLLIKHGGTFS
ncbi:MAG: poly-A polymerase [Waddliaceae bacterium]|nr:poly-A polymerase [Waddliaceae bacterium]